MSRTISTLSTWLPPEGEVLCRHDLAIVLRFVDPFIDPAMPVPLLMRPAITDRFVVRIASLDWEARYAPEDGTYRFSVSNASTEIPWQSAVILGIPSPPTFPASPVALSVDVEPKEPRRARYFVSSPINISLPIAGAPFASPQQQLAAYLIEVEAYPTPLFRASGGETCIRGIVTDNAGVPRNNVEVELFDPAQPPPNVLFARTDANGFFAYRLPWLRPPSPIPPSPNLGITVQQLGGPAFANISVTAHPAGNTSRASFAYRATTFITVQAF